MTKWVIRGRQSTGSSVYAEAFRILLPLMRRCISVLSRITSYFGDRTLAELPVGVLSSSHS
jgi:hypothetical protein